MEEKKWIDKLKFHLGLTEDLYTVRSITRIALLVAIAIILKSFLSLETGIWRFTLYDIPLFVLGIFYGPIFALMGGLATDFGYIMTRGMVYGFNIFTVTTIMWAFIPAVLLFRKRYTTTKLVVVVLFASVIAFTLNTIGLVGFFGQSQLVLFEGFVPGPLFPRIITALIKFPLQVYLIHVLVTRLKNAYEDLILVLK